MAPATRNNDRFRLPKLNLREDRAILIICIGIALVFWLLVKMSQTYRTERQVKLNFVLPDDRAFAEMPPRDVRVQLEGSGWDLMFEFFSNSEIPLFYDLRETDQLILNRGQLRTDIFNNLSSNDLKITEVNYDDINVTLEKKASKRVPVEPAIDLVLDPEYHLRRPVTITPDSVRLIGPASKIEPVEKWRTDSVVLSGVRSDKKVSLPLQKPPNEVILGTQSVEVQIEVEQFTEKSLFVPLTIRNAPDSLRLFPQRIKLTCVVGLSDYNRVTSKDFMVEVDLKDVPVSEDKNTAPIQLVSQPHFVKNVKFSPKSAEFYFVKQKKEEE